MQRTLAIFISVVLVLSAAIIVPRIQPASAARSTSFDSKKICKTVTKIVHGKKKKVKVCKTVKPTPVPTALPPDALARQLADTLASASTADARYQAVLAVLRALHIGVYTRDGAVVQHGDERNNADFYLYDFEVTALADAYGRQDTSSASDVAAMFSKVLSKADPTPTTTDEVHALIQTTTAAAVAESAEPGALALLIARDLGLHHNPSIDLAQEIPDSQLKLDAVQTFLIEAEFLVPMVRHLDAPTTVTRPLIHPNTPCPEVKEDPNERQQLGDKVLEWWGKKTLGDKLEKWSEKVAKAFKIKELIETIVDGLHGSVLAFSVKISRVGDGHRVTHYGPAGHAADAGKPIQFQMKVEMQDDLGETVINCLAMAGIKFPKKGPIKGVTVVWTFNQDLQKYGTLSPAPTTGGLVVKSTTEDDGIATLTFTPKDEKVPGFGQIVYEPQSGDPGIVSAIPLYQSAFDGEKASQIAQIIVPKYDVIGWEVAHHRPRGFRFSIKMSWDGVPDTSGSSGPPGGKGGCDGPGTCHGDTVSTHEDWTYEGSICGEDPYAAKDKYGSVYNSWNVTLTKTMQIKYSDGYTDTSTSHNTVPWSLQANNQFTGSFLSASQGDASFLSGPPPKVTIHAKQYAGGYWFWTPKEQTVSGTVEEDLGCPAS